MKKLFLFALSVTSLQIFAQELPENAQPGKCYIKCITADEFREESETIQIAPAYKKLKTVPATFKTITEEVMVKEPSVKKVYVPAVYETIMVNMDPDNAKNVNYEIVPAQFGKDNVSIETYPKTGKWEYTALKNCPSANKEDCMVACFVEAPARNTNVPITTLANDAYAKELPIPNAEYSYKKQVIKEPAKVDEIPIPAEYATIKKRVIDRPASVSEETVPAVSKNVSKTVLVKKGGMTVWEEVDCNIAAGNNILPIQYDINSALITAESKAIIDEHLLKLMNEKKGLRIEIGSHTDSRADDYYNMALSQQRAQAVVNYLVTNGISRNRLVAKGYGETRLKNKNCGNNSNCSDEQHHENRRTEFRILR